MSIVGIHSSSWEEPYVWLFLSDVSDESRAEEISKKTLELGKGLIDVFKKYGDETLMVVNGKGIIEFVGSKIAKTCGITSKELIGRNIHDVEADGIFYPSVSVKVLESGKYETVIQTTKTGKELVSVGAPVRNKKGKIERVVSVTRDYSTQIEISKIIAEIGDNVQANTDENEDYVDNIVTCNKTMFALKTTLKMIAPTTATVLITGESGTGKEVIARYIHAISDRKHQPFIKVNCGAISPSIIESELFGYEEGSFTGASKGGKTGLIEAANHGTLFLDEISELPLEQQVKLLHVLQERILTKVGGTRPIDLDIRIIAATNKPLDRLVDEGLFREDLFYRLNVIPVDIPPLRDRIDDIPLLGKHFLRRFCEQYNKNIQFSPNAVGEVERYSWPGNIRELENFVERVVLTATSPIVSAENVRNYLPKKREAAIAAKEAPSETEDLLEMAEGKSYTLDDAMEALERKLILEAIEKYGTTTKAAKALGVNQSTISRKIAKYHLKQ
ncbi:MAG: sigma 54-interacting transcriptional regulator [Firmicutes bacterium]|nr:sigma 54-interacting transcriptional regulator [Bacillota bacterium]